MTQVIAIQNLLQAAQQNQPLTLTSFEAREIALTLMGMDDLIAAYVNEYGPELARELTGADTIVEGEIVDDEETETPGRTSEDDGLDSSEEE